MIEFVLPDDKEAKKKVQLTFHRESDGSVSVRAQNASMFQVVLFIHADGTLERLQMYSPAIETLGFVVDKDGRIALREE